MTYEFRHANLPDGILKLSSTLPLFAKGTTVVYDAEHDYIISEVKFDIKNEKVIYQLIKF